MNTSQANDELQLLPSKRSNSKDNAPKSSFLSFITFFDMWNLVKSINSKRDPLQLNDLPPSFNFCNVEEKILALESEWASQFSKKKKPSIINATILAFRKEFLILVVLCFMTITLKFLTLPLMGIIINNISNRNFGQDSDFNSLLWSTIIFAIGTVIQALLYAWYWHLISVVTATIRNAIVGFTYRKLQQVTLSSIQQINVGKVVNLLSNDVNELDRGLPFVIPMILSPYTLSLAGSLLFKFFGFATIFGILGLVGFLIISNHLSNKTENIRAERSAVTDTRIKLTNELIECIRLIKMYAWEKAFQHAIQVLRDQEVLKLTKLRMISVLGESMGTTSAQLSLAIMCIIYTLSGGVLTPEKIFTSLILLTFVSMWGIEGFHNGRMFVSAIRVIKSRLESVLLIPEIQLLEDLPALPSEPSVIYKDYTAWWQSDQRSDMEKACLKNINLNLQPGQLTTVIGTIGSGKTSFLLSLLKEIPETKGELHIKGKIAYVEQEPVIFSGTIQSNILFGLEYDDQLYQTVIRACSLLEDFQQLTDYDQTRVGERGITLSGGQKARLSLARALYSKSDIYLLDDPLSAVDSKVGRNIFNYAIKGQILQDKIVILVTHHLDYAKQSDRVLLFSKGAIQGDATFEELKSQGSNLFDQFKTIEFEEEEDKNLTPSELKTEEVQDKAITNDDSKEGISFSTYKKYIDQNGSFKSLLLILTYCLIYALIFIGFSRLLGFWGQKNFEHSRSSSHTFNHAPYVIVTILLAPFVLFGDSLKFILYNNFILKTNSNMHSKALEKISNAPVSFFDKTPVGIVLNRFSNDLGILDKGNAELLPYAIDGYFYIFMRMMVLVIINPYLALPIVIVTIMSFKIKSFLQNPVMETKRIDLTSKSPMYSGISATLHGLLVIRTFRQSRSFIKKFTKLVQANNKAFLYMDRTIKFFIILMSVALDGLTVLGTFICIAIGYYTNLDAGIFGLALLMFQEIAGYGNWIVRTSLQVDINMQSVERILDYHQLDSEPPKHLPQDNSLRLNWPCDGQISFNNVYLKYRPELDYVLQGLTFKISPGCKVGIVGRTGTGKSSIIQALFRMAQIDTKIPGSSIEIDGVNIANLGLELLRKSISIIPQTPVVFTGTIRKNLDPFNEFTDSDLWHALLEVNLQQHVEKLEQGLHTDMSISNSVFSAGQKQLVCLARAVLRKNKIIVLDEATSNVDIETDEVIQKKIMERFQDCTVITIAHRLISIANYDKIMVLDKGKVVECDSPYLLMAKSKGDKLITKTDGVFAQMVLKSGESVANKIFAIAKEKFFKTH